MQQYFSNIKIYFCVEKGNENAHQRSGEERGTEIRACELQFNPVRNKKSISMLNLRCDSVICPGCVQRDQHASIHLETIVSSVAISAPRRHPAYAGRAAAKERLRLNKTMHKPHMRASAAHFPALVNQFIIFCALSSFRCADGAAKSCRHTDTHTAAANGRRQK